MKKTLTKLYCLIMMVLIMASCSGEKEGSTAQEFGLSEIWEVNDTSEMNIVSNNFYDIDGMRTIMAILYFPNDEFGEDLNLLSFSIYTPDSIHGKNSPKFAPDIQSLEIKNNEGEVLTVPVFLLDNKLLIRVPSTDYETVARENAYVFTFMCYSKEISIKTKLNNGKEYTWKFNSYVNSNNHPNP